MVLALASALEWCLELVAPSRCAACAEPASPGAAFCAACRRALSPPVTERLAHVPLYVAARYAGPVVQAVHRLKYEDHPELARPLGRFVAERLRPALPPADWLIPVPLHPHRLAERGYNQSSLLAAALSRSLDIEAAPRALRRLRATAQQARLTQCERSENVRAAFQSRSFEKTARVILVDDVVTTGATVLECAGALEQGGADVVAVLALARAGPPNPLTHASEK